MEMNTVHTGGGLPRRSIRRLVDELKEASGDAQITLLQEMGGALINDYRLEAFGVVLEPLWVEAYYYHRERFPDENIHMRAKQKNRFGQLYFHERGYGGLDICLSDSDDYYLSFLLKATLANGHFLTQTRIYDILSYAGKTKTEFEALAHVLVPADAHHTVCHTTRVNLARPCYRDAPLAAFALDAVPRYDFRFARSDLRSTVKAYLSSYIAAHPGCTAKACKDECRRVFGWVPASVSELTRGL